MIEPRVSVPIAKRDAAGGGRRSRAGRRSARARAADSTGLFVRSAEPAIALRERAERELGHEHRAGLAQPLDDRRVVVEHLIDVRLAAPRRA